MNHQEILAQFGFKPYIPPAEPETVKEQPEAIEATIPISSEIPLENENQQNIISDESKTTLEVKEEESISDDADIDKEEPKIKKPMYINETLDLRVEIGDDDDLSELSVVIFNHAHAEGHKKGHKEGEKSGYEKGIQAGRKYNQLEVRKALGIN